MDRMNDILLKTKQHQFADGLLELMLGSFMLISSLALGLVAHPILSGLVAVAGILAAARLFARLRMGLSYPRSGYVRFHEETGKGRVLNVITGFVTTFLILSIFIWLLFRNPDSALGWLAFLVGTVIGLSLLVQGFRLRLWRLSLLGFASLLFGLFLSPLVLTSDLLTGYAGISLMSAYFLAIGLCLSLSGGIVLARFLRNRKPDGTQ